MLLRFTYLLLLSFVLNVPLCIAQTNGQTGKIVKSAVIIDNDTLAHTYLPTVTVMNQELLAMNSRERKKYYKQRKRRRKRYTKLKRNVYKTYPYAVMAGYVMHDIDSAMLTIRSKEAKEVYKRRKEKELTKQYKGRLENLTMSQGKVLVILIARQTGKDCYTTIKELKGGFNARMYQTLATLFANNLKRNYEPNGKDASIELICREIEASGKFVRTN